MISTLKAKLVWILIANFACASTAWCQEDTRPRENVVSGEIKQDPQLVLKYLSEHIASFPNDPKLYIRRGDLYFNKLDQPQKAFADFDRAVKLQPRNPQALIKRGVARRDLGQHTQSMADMRAAMNLDPSTVKQIKDDPDSPFWLMEQWEESLTTLDQRLLLDPDNARIYFHRGLVNKGTGNHPAAIADFSRALQLLKDSPTAAGKPEEIPTLFLDADHIIQTPDELKREILYTRSLCYYSRQKYALARLDIDQALELNPGLEPLWTMKGEIEELDKKPDAALEAYARACQINPHSYSEAARSDLLKRLGRNEKTRAYGSH